MDVSIDVRNKLAVFLACELDCNSGHLNVAGIEQKLEPMVHQFLLVLIQQQGNIVSKQTVLEKLWPNKTPSDEALRALVKKAREALKDNARNPTYIKTIPTKGYLLIPVVVLTSTVVQSWILQHAKLIMWAGLIGIVSIFLMAYHLYSPSTATKLPSEIILTKTKIGIVSNSKVSTYYINSELKNIWIEESDFSNTSQLIIADIATKYQLKIVFPSILESQFWYSKGSQRLLVKRSDKNGFYAIQFGRQSREPSIIEHKLILPEDAAISSLDYNGNHIFVVSTDKSLLSLLNLETGEVLSRPAMLSIQDTLRETEKELLIAGDQDVTVNAWPSPTSSGLLVSFDFRHKTRLIYYDSINDLMPLGSIDIKGGLQSAVWDHQGKRFSFTNDNAEFFAFQVRESKLTRFNMKGQSVNHVVADCGSNCFVIANTNGIPKLSEFTNPFFEKEDSSDLNKPYARIIQTNSIPRNEYLPQYTTRGLYFVSQHEGITKLIFRDNNYQENTVFTFASRAIIEELTVDKNENFIAGMVNQRPFILDLNTLKLSFIPLTFPHVSHLAFTADNTLNFYADTTAIGGLKKNTVSSQSANEIMTNIGQANGLYKFNLDTQQIDLLKVNVKALRAIELVDVTDKGSSRDKAVLALNNNGIITVSFQNNRPAIVIDIGTNDCTNCWHVKGNYLYQIHPNTKEGTSSQITRINLLTEEQTEQSLFNRDLLNTFSMHPQTNKIIVTTRQNLQTELIKIEGLTQVY